MQTFRSESLLVLPLFPIFLLGAFPLLLLSFLGFAGMGILGALMIATAVIVAFEADTEFNTQSSAVSFPGRGERNMPSSTGDAMVRSAKVIGAIGTVSVIIAVAGAVTIG